MTREEAIRELKQFSGTTRLRLSANFWEALDVAIKALEIVEEFEKAQIITGGRLNGRTYAYKCGLEDGKRKALEQEGYYKDLAQSYEKTIVKLTEAVTEQQPNEDCVSRQAVIKTLNDIWLSGTCARRIIDEQIDKVRALPPVTPTQKWIPVSERLPEEDGFYLATLDGEICGEDEPISGMAEFENGKWVDDEDDYQCVLAWMPLPEPYKAEMESKE